MEDRKPSVRNLGGVSAVRQSLYKEIFDRLVQRFTDRRNSGYNDLSDDEVHHLARIGALEGSTKAMDAVAQSFQMGVDSNATADDYDRPTARIPDPGSVKK